MHSLHKLQIYLMLGHAIAQYLLHVNAFLTDINQFKCKFWNLIINKMRSFCITAWTFGPCIYIVYADDVVIVGDHIGDVQKLLNTEETVLLSNVLQRMLSLG